jgi:hypothetical protein
MSKNTLILVGTAVVSATVGVFAGFLIAKKTLVEGYEEILQGEIREIKAFYNTLHKKEAFSTPQEAAAKLLPKPQAKVFEENPVWDAIQEYVTEEDSAKTLLRNTFEVQDPDLDEIMAEESARSEDTPYIISSEEFFGAENGYRQICFTYFEGDKILADEEEAAIEDFETYIGKENVLRFGHRSDDENVVYVRNEHLEVEFEITRSTGKYSEEVVGLRDDD